MKREIKFRYIFQNQNGRESIEIISLPELQLFEFSEKFMCECVLSVDQYTEKKDKTGKEVYDGDILHSSKLKRNFLVIPDEKTGGYNGYNSPFLLIPHDFCMCEIIGNIHQNKDLMKLIK